jgi:hypothetical protein
MLVVARKRFVFVVVLRVCFILMNKCCLTGRTRVTQATGPASMEAELDPGVPEALGPRWAEKVASVPRYMACTHVSGSIGARHGRPFVDLAAAVLRAGGYASWALEPRVKRRIQTCSRQNWRYELPDSREHTLFLRCLV